MIAPHTSPHPMPQLAGNTFQRLVPVNSLPVTRRNLLFADCELQPLRKGDTLFEAGDTDDQIYYLVEGRIELRDSNRNRTVIEAGNELPLNPFRPRTATARALSQATVLHCSRRWFDSLLLPPLLQPYVTADGTGDKERAQDWLQQLMSSTLFKRLPAPNLQQLFSQCEPLAFGQGQVVVNQGSEDDSFYIIQSGRCEVVHVDGNNNVTERLAVLGPGDWFGEVSLLAGCPGSITVTMLADGALLRLQRRGFQDLIRQPLVEEVNVETAHQHLENGAHWLDVREPAEVENDPLEDTAHCAFDSLLEDAGALEADRHYVVICDSGARSAIAAFLLAVRGFSVSRLRGGMAALRGWTPAETETGTTIINGSDPLLQSLRADLTRLLRHVDNAMRLKGDAESARREAERAARKQMEDERVRLRDQALQVRTMLEQTQKLQRRLVEEKDRLYSGLKRREQAVERRINNLNAYIEQRVAEERERIESTYSSHENEIQRLESEKQAAESRIRTDSAADDDKQQVCQALESEFERVSDKLRDAENERSRVRAATLTQELVSEISRDLDNEDQEKLAGYQETQSTLTQQREQLEARAQQLSSAVKESLFDKQASAAVRDALMREAGQPGNDSSEEDRDCTDDALRAATARYNEADEAYQNALNAEQENRNALAETEEAESKLMQDLNAEIEAWMEEQANQKPSPKQQELISRYEDTMQRLQKEATEAEEQERTRDDLLLSDINAELEQIAEKRAKKMEH